MLQNDRVRAITVSELLRENEQHITHPQRFGLKQD